MIFPFEQLDLLSVLKYSAKKKSNGIPYLICLTDGIIFFLSLQVWIYIVQFLIHLPAKEIWFVFCCVSSGINRKSTGQIQLSLTLVESYWLRYISAVFSGETEGYASAIARESTNLFIIFCPKDPACFPAGELVLDLRKWIKWKKTYISRGVSNTVLTTYTKLDQACATFQKIFARKYPLLPSTARQFLITKSRAIFTI